MSEKMGELIEKKAIELIEGIRRQARPRVSQEKLGEYLWPRRYDEEGREIGDPQKSYSILLHAPKGKDSRRLKLGEFINACLVLNRDPLEVLTMAKLAAERGLEVDALLGESKVSGSVPPATDRKEQTGNPRAGKKGAGHA